MLRRISRAWRIAKLDESQLDELSRIVPDMENAVGDGKASVLVPMTEEEISVWEREQDGWGPLLGVLRNLGRKPTYSKDDFLPADDMSYEKWQGMGSPTAMEEAAKKVSRYL